MKSQRFPNCWTVGSTVTIDAMGCQTAIAEKITEKQTNYVLAEKNNQPTLHEEMKEYFKWAVNDPIEKKNIDTFSSYDGEHDRIVTRTVEVTKEIGW